MLLWLLIFYILHFSCVCAHGNNCSAGQKRESDPLDLELELIASN